MEYRDWFFAILGTGGIIIIPWLTKKWYHAILILISFVVLYIAAILISDRLFDGEKDKNQTIR